MSESEQTQKLLRSAVAAFQNGRRDEADEKLRRVLIQNDRNADAHHLLGLIAMDRRQRDLAVDHLRQAVSINPDGAPFHNSLGVHYMRERRFAQGIHHFWQALALDRNYQDALKNLIVGLRDVGDFEEVLRLSERALSLAPKSIEILFSRARAFQLLQRNSEAVDAYRRTLEVESQHVPSLTELGYVHLDRDDFPAAEDSFKKAVEHHPRHVRALNGLGHVYAQTRRDTEAIAVWELALEVEPNAPAVLTSLGIAYVETGRIAEGRALLQKAIDLVPRHAEAHLAFVQSGKVEPDSPEIVRLQSLVDNDSIPDEDRAKLSFSLGKALEDTAQYEAAFQNYLNGNRLKRGLVDFHIRPVRNQVNSLIDFFTPERLAALRDQIGIQTDKPVFVVGMPRSGTTLVEQIISSHPQVHGAGELPHLEQLIGRLPDLSASRVAYPQCLEQLPVDIIRDQAQQHLDFLQNMAPEALRIVDKMPRNAFNVGLIALLWPQARIVHCRRSPMDVCLSCFTRYFARGQNFSWNLTELGSYYREYERISQHWKSTLQLPILEVQYEELTNDPETITRRMIEHIDLEWDDACLQFHETERRIRTNPVQVRKPVYRSSVARWQRFEPWLGELKEALGSLAENS